MNWQAWSEEVQAVRIRQLEHRLAWSEKARRSLAGRLRDQTRRAEYWRNRALELRDRNRDRERWYGR